MPFFSTTVAGTAASLNPGDVVDGATGDFSLLKRRAARGAILHPGMVGLPLDAIRTLMVATEDQPLRLENRTDTAAARLLRRPTTR